MAKETDFDRVLKLTQVMEAATKFPDLAPFASEARKELERMKSNAASLQADALKPRPPNKPVKVEAEPEGDVATGDPIERRA